MNGDTIKKQVVITKEPPVQKTGIDIEEKFKGFTDVLLGVLKDTGAKYVAEIPAVQKEIEKAKVTEGKNLLWKYFPLIALVAVVAIFIKRF